MKKIVGFFGGGSQTGTSMLAQSTAEALVRLERKVLLVQVSGKGFGAFFSECQSKKSIDDIKANIINGTVLQEDIKPVIDSYDGLDVIRDVKDPYGAAFFPVNTFEVMIKALMDDYEYIIIDGGDNVSLGSTISAMNIADEVYFVITQQKNILQRFETLKKAVLDPLNLSCELIINKYITNPALLLRKEIENMLRIPVISAVPYSEYGWQSEMEGRTLMRFKKFNRAVTMIAEKIDGIDGAETGRGKSRLWKKDFL